MLSDLVPEILATEFRPRVVGTPRQLATARHLRWVAKNREQFNAYRREWWAKRKAA